MLWKLLKEMKPDERPTHLAVVFDKSEKTFRTEMYKEYKAHRPPPPDDLIPQFPLIRDAVRAFEIPCLEQAGYEADDLIATYARIACEAGATATIVSSDKDLMQLVNECVVMYDTMKDVRIGVPEVIEKFGVPPDEGHRGAGADRRFNRQRARCAGHRREDRCPTDRRIWRPRNTAQARKRDQAGQAPPGARRQCRGRAYFEKTRHPRRSGASRCVGRKPRRPTNPTTKR